MYMQGGLLPDADPTVGRPSPPDADPLDADPQMHTPPDVYPTPQMQTVAVGRPPVLWSMMHPGKVPPWTE